jgi:hypothetical protein
MDMKPLGCMIFLACCAFPAMAQEKAERIRQLEAENAELKAQLATLREARRERFRNLLIDYAHEKDEVTSNRLLYDMALTTGKS